MGRVSLVWNFLRSQVIHQIKVIIMLKNNYFIKFILFSHSTFIFNFFLKSTFFSILFLFSLHQSNKKQNIIVLFIFLFSFRSKHTDFYLFLCIPTSLRIYDDIFDFSFLFSIGWLHFGFQPQRYKLHGGIQTKLSATNSSQRSMNCINKYKSYFSLFST